MADRKYRVVYDVIVNTSDLVRGTQKAKAETRALKDEQISANRQVSASQAKADSASKQSQRVHKEHATAVRDDTAAVHRLGAALAGLFSRQKRATVVTREHTKAVRDHTDGVNSLTRAYEGGTSGISRYQSVLASLGRTMIRARQSKTELDTAMRKSSSGGQLTLDGLDTFGPKSERATGGLRRMLQGMRLLRGESRGTSKSLAEVEGSSRRVGSAMAAAGGRAAKFGSTLTWVASFGLAAKFQLIGLAIQPIISGLIALGGAAVIAVGGLAELTPALLAVPAGIAAAVSGFAATKIALGGMGEAFKLFGQEANKNKPETFADSLKQLNPAAASVVKSLTDLYPAWKKIQNSVQGAFFKPLVGQMGSLKGLLPTVSGLLTDAASAMGGVAARAVEMVASSEWKDSFAALGPTNVSIINNLGDALLSVLDGLRQIAVAGAPLAEFFSDLTARAGASFKAWTDGLISGNGPSEKFAGQIEKVKTRFVQFSAIIKNLGSVIASVFRAAGPAIDWFMAASVKKTEEWSAKLKEVSGPAGALTQYFTSLIPVMQTLGRLIGTLGRGLLQINNVAQFDKIANAIDQKLLPAVVRFIKLFGEGTIQENIVSSLASIIETINQLLDSGLFVGMEMFFKVLNMVAKGINAVASAPLIGPVLKGIVTSLSLLSAVAFVGGGLTLFIGKLTAFIPMGMRVAQVFRDIAVAAKTAAAASLAADTASGAQLMLPGMGKAGKGAKGLSGSLGRLKNVLGAVGKAMLGMTGAAATLGPVLTTLLNPLILIPTLLIGAATASAVWLTNMKKQQFEARAAATSVDEYAAALRRAGQDRAKAGSAPAQVDTSQTRIAGGAWAQGGTSVSKVSDDVQQAANRVAELQQKIQFGLTGSGDAAAKSLKNVEAAILQMADTANAKGDFQGFQSGIQELLRAAKGAGMGMDELAAKVPEVSAFLAKYGETIDSFDKDPFAQARIGARIFLDGLVANKAKAEETKKTTDELAKSFDSIANQAKSGKYKSLDLFTVDPTTGGKLATALGGDIQAAVAQLDQVRQANIEMGMSAAEADTNYNAMVATLLSSIPATSSNIEQFDALRKSISTTTLAVKQAGGNGASFTIEAGVNGADLTVSKLMQIEGARTKANGNVVIPAKSINDQQTRANLLSVAGAKVMANGDVIIPVTENGSVGVIGKLISLKMTALGVNGTRVVINTATTGGYLTLAQLLQIQGARVKANGNVVIPTSSIGDRQTIDNLIAVTGARETADGKVIIPVTAITGQAQQDLTDTKAKVEYLERTGQVNVNATLTDQASDPMSTLQGLAKALNEFDPVIKVTAEDSMARTDLDSLNNYVFNTKTIWVDVKEKQESGGLVGLWNSITASSLGYALGGAVQRFAGGGSPETRKRGKISGVGYKDSIPSILMPGEFVMRKKAVQQIGVARLMEMNRAEPGDRSLRRQRQGIQAPVEMAYGGKVAEDFAKDMGYQDYNAWKKKRQSENKKLKAKKSTSQKSYVEQYLKRQPDWGPYSAAYLKEGNDQWMSALDPKSAVRKKYERAQKKERQREAGRRAADELQQFQESYTQAVLDGEKAQRALTRAQNDAGRQYDDLTRDIANFQITLAELNASETQAYENLQRTLNDPAATKGQRMAAQAAYDRAKADTEAAKVQDERNREDIGMVKNEKTGEWSAAPSRKKFIDSSDSVTSAKQQKDQATRQETAARKGLRRAGAYNSNKRNATVAKLIADGFLAVLDEITSRAGKGRALGGPVRPGGPYLVGERGPELVFPERRGRVITAGKTRKMLKDQRQIMEMLEVQRRASWTEMSLLLSGLGPGALPGQEIGGSGMGKEAMKAAMSSTSVDKSSTFSVGSMVINNPRQERASDSIQRRVKKLTSRKP